MAVGIVFYVVGKLVEYTIDPILCQFKYMFCYKTKILTLMDKVKDLEIKESDVQQLVVEVERNAEAIKPGTKDWLQKVDDLKKQAYEVLEGTTNSEMKATKKTVEVDKLLVEGAFETRISTKKKIIEALKDKDVSIIGICGMPGVGKTTMANEIANEVKVDKLFNEVAIAVASQDPDVTKIQDQLADMLGFKIEEKTNKIVRDG
ncbi:uncharacterized protein LOC111375061 [Olea europaea var. sylvestris]|uniref:uncharacterized protein LOC111375061 n=1 Tax=Olea europaea var. sylvestris TaxID=158386 RepID=UPI000C1D1D0F|nr:uncharacterized protein LOC111375061 [Olea europaea var. sylvestris]